MRKEGLHARVGLQLVAHQGALVAGEEAMGLYMFCVIYSRSNELDGFVPLEAAERGWTGNLDGNRARLKTLCSRRVGFLKRVDDGYEIQKYADFNETKADIAERRAGGRKRQNKHRDEMSRVTDALVTVSDSVSVVSDLISLPDSDPDVPEPCGSPREAYAAEVNPPRDPLAATFTAAAYAAGQLDAGADAYPVPSEPQDIRALDRIVAYAPPAEGRALRGEALSAWFRATSAAYRRAQASASEYQCGFSPRKCLEWLKNGRPRAEDRHSGPRLLRPGAPLLQSPVDRCWEIPAAALEAAR